MRHDEKKERDSRVKVYRGLEVEPRKIGDLKYHRGWYKPQEKVIQELVESIKEVGFLYPLLIDKSDFIIDGYQRCDALKRAGMIWADVTVLKTNFSEDMYIARIDANLISRDFTVLERCEMERERKIYYIKKHPETQAGVAQAVGMHKKLGNNVTAESAVTSFVADTANKTGRSERVVYQEIQIAENLIPEVKDAIRGTKLENRKTDLLNLSRKDIETQMKVIEVVESGEADTVSAAISAVEKQESQKPDKVYKVIVTDMDNFGFQAEENAALFLRAPNSNLDKAFNKLEKIDFNYQTGFIVLKEESENFESFCGALREIHEMVLFATKGDCQPMPCVPPVDLLIDVGEDKEMQEKEIRDRIHRLFPTGSRVDFTATTATDGWDTPHLVCEKSA